MSVEGERREHTFKSLQAASILKAKNSNDSSKHVLMPLMADNARDSYMKYLCSSNEVSTFGGVESKKGRLNLQQCIQMYMCETYWTFFLKLKDMK